MSSISQNAETLPPGVDWIATFETWPQFFIYLVTLNLSTTAPQCTSYTLLEEANRKASFSDKSTIKCDKPMKKKWYRFADTAGNKMAASCVPRKHCGTHAPGWLNGTHPAIADGIVTRQVCFHWRKGCCQWKKNIRIMNCGGFYVYELQNPPVCNTRYCGESDKGEGKKSRAVDSSCSVTKAESCCIGHSKGLEHHSHH